MQFPTCLSLLALISTLFSLSSAAPLTNARHPARASADDAVDKRQAQLVAVAEIINAAQTVMNAIEAIVDTIDGDIHAAEGQFTQDLVSNLRQQYPTMNVLVFHNQDCIYSLYGASHAHVEMDIGLGFTQGYEVWVFDYGTFTLVGDGGFENYAYGGDYSGPSSDIVFSSMNGN